MLSQSHNDQVTTSEVIWMLRLVECNMPFSACDGIGPVFKQMFPGSVSNDFSCSSQKAMYVIRFGFKPYFKNRLLEDIRVRWRVYNSVR